MIANQMGISSVGLVTDLTYEDVVRFKDCKEITADDILEVYHLFREKTSIEKIFGQ